MFKRRAPAESWQRDLYILWGCNFVLQLGFSLIMPFLPLYLEELNVQGPAVDLWSGVIFSANFVVMAIFSPIWGALSDRTGRKPMMLRSAFGMGLVVWLMGLVTSVYQLVGLRLLQGVAAGFIAATMAYIAGIVPRDRSGYALGLLGNGATAGTILGPLLGGVLSRWIGYRPIFFLTSLSCLVAGAVVYFTIREEFTPVARQQREGLISDFRLVARYPVVLAMTVVLFMNTFSILTAEPVLARFLRDLDAPLEWVSFLSGVVFSMTGAANLLVAPMSGKLSDRFGSRRLLVVCLGGAALLYVAQGFATATWQMVILRFVLGIFTGGLMPAAGGLIARTAPRDLQGRIFGLTNSAIFLGNTVGPLVGGAVAAQFGLRAVFPVTGALLLADLLWVTLGVHEKAPGQE
ncbi:MAG TPA: MFS transporter [Symbiobacteriaceae bacterium]|nr:MFS transporter [Symbiobacteriaceae bacterium]